MKYIGWIIALLAIVATIYLYSAKYAPLKQSVQRLEQEIKLWEETLKGEKILTGDVNRFPPEKFFDNDKLTPYAEVEILRRFDRRHEGIDIYITAPNALARMEDIMRFLSEQKIDYTKIYCIAAIDSIERFEYKYTK
jgi:hypothetical protein